ncbi:response regulator [Myxococcota bacterium]|nr:response regulator [Myxococcota bacterium]MBU1497344.1 response regulator [Myxococcota bacterium]
MDGLTSLKSKFAALDIKIRKLKDLHTESADALYRLNDFSFFQAMPDPFTVQYLSGEILFINEAARALWKSSMVKPDFRPPLFLGEKVRAHGLPQQKHMFYHEKSMWFDVRAWPVIDSKGDIYAIAEQLVEITNEKIKQLRISERESDLLEILDSMNDGVIALDSAQNILVVNRFMLPFLREGSPNLRGLAVSSILDCYSFHEKKKIDWTRVDEIPGIIQLLDNKGQWRIFEVRKNSSSILDFSGPSMILVFRDQTALHEATRKLTRSERLYRTIFNKFPLGIMMYDKDMRIIESNAMFSAIMQNPIDNLIGFNLENIPDKRPLPALRKPLQGEEGFYEGEYISMVTGGIIGLRASTTPVFDSERNVTGAICAITDVTEKLQTESEKSAALARLKAQRDALLELGSSDNDMDDTSKMVARICCEVLGADFSSIYHFRQKDNIYHCSALYSRPRERFYKGRSFSRTDYAPLIKALRTSNFVVHHAEDSLFDGAWKWFKRRQVEEICNIPLKISNRLAGLIQLEFSTPCRTWHEDESRFVSELASHLVLALTREKANADRVAQHALQIKMYQAQKLESLGVLAGGVAHDFNNLLMAIMGNANLAKMEVSSEQTLYEYIDAIETSSRRAADLVRQLLAYSGKGKYIIEKFRLQDLIADSTQLVSVNAPLSSSITVTSSRDELPISGDSSQIRQVIVNLMTNSAEALADTGGNILVSTGSSFLSSAELEQFWSDFDLEEGWFSFLEVQDNGYGISPDVLPLIFDPFFSTKFMGRGLGLPAVSGIVKSHGGGYLISSEIDAGTTFRIILPALADANIEPNLENAPESISENAVLIVDDEDMIRKVAEKMIHKLGFDVFTATDGETALEIFKENAAIIRFVLLDLTMPGMGGEKCFDEMKKIRDDVRIIISSGYSSLEVESRFRGKGLTGLINKPYSFANLRECIKVHNLLPEPQS